MNRIHPRRPILPSDIWQPTALVAVAAAMIAVLLAVLRPGGGPFESSLRELAEAVGTRRTTMARLSGGFVYGPLQSPSRASLEFAVANLPLITAAARAQLAAQASPTAPNLRTYGIALLLLADYDDAIANLQAAFEQEPANAALMNDLAVAFGERARQTNRAGDYPRWLEYAERAIHAGNTSVEAQFTHAAALDRIGLRDRAIDAWNDYLRIDGTSGWAQEARSRVTVLQNAGVRDRWKDLEHLTSSRALRAEDLDLVARDVPDRVPEVLLGFALANWANSRSPADLSIAGGLANAFAKQTGDESLRRAIEDLESQHGDDGAVRSLATGYALLARDRYGDAEPHLEDALTGLRAANPVLRDWAWFGIGRARYFRGAVEQAERDFASVIDSATAHQAPALAARARWLRGIVRFTQGQWAQARGFYEDAIRTYDAMHDAQGVATVHVNLSILFRFLGDSESVWQHRMVALNRIPTHLPTLAHGFLLTTAVTASQENLERVALLFLDEAVKNSQSAIPVYTKAETLLQRAKALDRIGRHGDAEADLAAANDEWRDIDDAGIKQRVRLSWLTAAAQIHHDTSPPAAVLEAREAIGNAKQRGDLLRAAELHLYLGRALAKNGEPDQAREAIDAGIAAFSSARASMAADDPIRLSAFEPVWELYDEAFAQQTNAAEFDRQSAFERYESSRARTLLELRSERSRTLPDVQAHLAADQTLVLLHQRTTGLIAWIIDRDGDRLERVPVTQKAAERLTSAYLWRLRSNEDAKMISRELFTAVLKPILEHIPEGHAISIVSDAPFVGIPWAALVDPATGDPVLTRRSITVSPNASLTVSSRRDEPWRPPANALVVSAADVQSGLPMLGGARDEARQIAAIHAGSTLLEGPDATASRLLDRMPSSRLIHVAAHTVSNAGYPLLSRLLLSAEPGDLDGLSVSELLRARRLDPDSLVVLAACRTLGETRMRGEGAIGIAWGFLAAGASRVVATLWDVDDARIAPVLVDFHRRLAAGVSPSAALRAAQLAAFEGGQDERIWGALQLVGLP